MTALGQLGHATELCYDSYIIMIIGEFLLFWISNAYVRASINSTIDER